MPIQAEPAPEPRPRVWFIPVAVIAVAVFGIVIATRKSPQVVPPDALSQPPADTALAIDAAQVAIDAAQPDAPVDAAVAPDAAVAIDAAPPPVDAAVGSGSARIRPPAGSGSARAGSGSGSGTKAGSGSGSGAIVVPAIVTHKVTINATPWAYFTVDGGPRMQTPKVLELSQGPHKIHFENPVLKVEREITLDVPDHDISWVEPLGH